MVFHSVLLKMTRYKKLSLTLKRTLLSDFFLEPTCLLLPQLVPQTGQWYPGQVNSILEYVSMPLLEYYTCSQLLWDDESTFNFKGHIIFKMYRPQKPVKWGVWIYVTEDALNRYVVYDPLFVSFTNNSLMW